ncbi:hypothetical protein FF1_046809 [Malus domestica]
MHTFIRSGDYKVYHYSRQPGSVSNAVLPMPTAKRFHVIQASYFVLTTIARANHPQKLFKTLASCSQIEMVSSVPIRMIVTNLIFHAHRDSLSVSTDNANVMIFSNKLIS